MIIVLNARAAWEVWEAAEEKLAAHAIAGEFDDAQPASCGRPTC